MKEILPLGKGKQGPSSLWDKVARTCLYLLGILLPLWALPITIAPLETNKVFLAYILILIAFLAWLVSRIQAGFVVLPRNFLAAALGVLVLVWGFSGIFSVSRNVSFSALASDPSGFFAILMFVLASFLASFYFRTPEYIARWLLGFLGSATVLLLFQIIKVGFSINLAPWINLPFKTSNLFGSWAEFGIYFSLVGFISLFLFETTRLKKPRIFFLGMTAAALLAMIAVNIQIIWFVFLVFLLVLLAYLFSLTLRARDLFRPTFIIAFIVLFLLQAPVLVSIVTAYFDTQFVEVRPSFAASWMVTESALEENTFFGSGPATFLYDWIRYKPIDVNQGQFWNVRFASGAAFLPSMLAVTGLAGALAFLFLIGSFFFYGFKALIRTGRPDSFLVLVFSTVAMLFAYSILYNPGFVLTLFFFLFLGMFLGLLSEHALAGEFKVKLFANSGVSFISALAIIFLLIITVSGMYLFSQKYTAAYFFGRGVSLFNVEGDIPRAEAAVSRAINLEKRDEYYRGLVDIRLRQIALLLNRQDLAPQDLQAQFQSLLSSAIQSAQAATELNPVDPVNWIKLGQIYESVIPFNISGVTDFAIASYQEAAARNPTSPEPIFAQARIMVFLQEKARSRELLEDTLRLKRNYTPAHLLLAQLEDQEGNIGKAIERVQAAAILSPSDVGVVFQLGLLYYRDDQLENARLVFERTISLNPNYSNARYFLGLIYDQLGNSEKALEQFRRIQILNPENEEVKSIIANLQAQKEALEDISPPAPEPEERVRPPIEE